jgi:hypothetical protein
MYKSFQKRFKSKKNFFEKSSVKNKKMDKMIKNKIGASLLITNLVVAMVAFAVLIGGIGIVSGGVVEEMINEGFTMEQITEGKAKFTSEGYTAEQIEKIEYGNLYAWKFYKNLDPWGTGGNGNKVSMSYLNEIEEKGIDIREVNSIYEKNYGESLPQAFYGDFSGKQQDQVISTYNGLMLKSTSISKTSALGNQFVEAVGTNWDGTDMNGLDNFMGEFKKLNPIERDAVEAAVEGKIGKTIGVALKDETSEFSDVFAGTKDQEDYQNELQEIRLTNPTEQSLGRAVYDNTEGLDIRIFGSGEEVRLKSALDISANREDISMENVEKTVRESALINDPAASDKELNIKDRIEGDFSGKTEDEYVKVYEDAVKEAAAGNDGGAANIQTAAEKEAIKMSEEMDEMLEGSSQLEKEKEYLEDLAATREAITAAENDENIPIISPPKKPPVDDDIPTPTTVKSVLEGYKNKDLVYYNGKQVKVVNKDGVAGFTNADKKFEAFKTGGLEEFTNFKNGQLVTYNDEQVEVTHENGLAGFTNDNGEFEAFGSSDVKGVGTGAALSAALTENLVSNALWAVGAGFTVSQVAGMFGASDGTQKAFFASVTVGLMTQKVVAQYLTKKGVTGLFKGKLTGIFGTKGIGAGTAGIIVGGIIFAMMYKKTSTEVVEFNCLPYQPPIGGDDCELCNEIDGGCSEYRCKSLGQACDVVNSGTEDEKCVWINPHDVNSPKLRVSEVLDGYIYRPDTSVRPPATGVTILQENGDDVEPFTALEFTIETDEPAQCKIDYNLTTSFAEMSYFIGGTNIYSVNHTETMSLPSPDAVNAISPELKNDGTYTLYVRCSDANGNFNQDAYSVRFKVKDGPDTTPPKIVDLSVPSNSPVSHDQEELGLEVYVNEPAQCKWSREDKDYELMENSMNCNTNIWEMNNRNVYTCGTTLNAIQNQQDNDYYIRCKDNPGAAEGDRNVNSQSSLYTVIGTQILTIKEVRPEEGDLVKSATNTVPVFLEIETDNGYNNGDAFCYYTTEEGVDGRGEEGEFILFSDTETNIHKQRQDLSSGDYTYYFKCVDLGGNAVYDSTEFEVESDNTSPLIVRVYKQSGQLRIFTSEEASCAYSNKDCNFEIEEGIKMAVDVDDQTHATDWVTNKNFYVRCNDEFGNEPAIQIGDEGCSIVIRPYEIDVVNSNVVVL